MRLIHTIYEPAGSGPHPTIVAFHGWGSNALDLLGLAPYLAQGRFMVICPQGPLQVPIGPVRGHGWFELKMGTPADPADVDAAVDEAERFIDEVVERYPVERRKLVMLGFSQGGVMAYSLAMRQPERFAALVALSSWFPAELGGKAQKREALEQLPTLVQHGRADDMIEVARARQSVDNLRVFKVPVIYKEYDCGHEVTAESLTDLSQFLTDKVVSPLISLR